MLGETVVCAAISQHLHMLSQSGVAHHSGSWDFWDFKNGVFHVVKITVAENNPDMELLTQQTFGFSPAVLARDITDANNDGI